MWILLKQGGLPYGGLNFDAKLRRGSTDPMDLFHAHIGGIDTYARALLVADRLVHDCVLESFIEERYAGYREGIGKRFLDGAVTLPELERWALGEPEPELRSGREERIENVLNQYLYHSGIE